MITARDIAQQVGVSISTVGRALSDDDRISLETRDRVKRAAEAFGYAGNVPAKMMRGGSSNLIGLLVPEISNTFYGSIAQALSNTCDKEGYRLVLSLTGDDPEREARHVRELTGARAAGLIIVPTSSPTQSCTTLLKQIPHVQLLRRLPTLDDACFGINDTDAIACAARHLVGLGHRNIAYIGGRESLSTGARRVEGFRKALIDTTVTGTEMLGSTTADHGLASFQTLIDMPQRPTAVLAGSVNVTTGLVQAIEHSSVRVPADLSVIGFGDADWFRWWRGGLTTVQPPIADLATQCGQWFLDVLQDRLATVWQPGSHRMEIDCTLLLRSTARAIGM